MTDRKKPGVAFWITVALVVVLAVYSLSFGPACWIHERKGIGESTIPILYYPIIWISERCQLNDITFRYATGGKCPAMFPAIGEDGQVQWCVDLPERGK